MVAFYNQGDQNIYKDFQYVPQEKYRLGFTAPVQGGEQNASTPSFGITNTNAFTNSGGNNSYSGPTSNLINNFNAINQDKYMDSQKTPNVDMNYNQKLQANFMGMPSYRQQELTGPDLGEYIGGQEIGYTPGGELGFSYGTEVPLEQTMAGKIQSGLGKGKDLISKGAGMAFNAALGIPGLSYALGKMDRFNTLPAMDKEFINQNKYYTGPTVFGENASGLGKDPYGINVRSTLGNYGAYVDKMAAGYKDITDEEFEKLSNFKKTKIGFYREKAKQRARDLEIAQSAAAAANDRATNQGFQRAMAQGREFYDQFGKGGQEASQTREEAGPGFSGSGTAAEMGSFAKGGRAGYFFGGRVNFKNGGLAGLL